MTHRRAIHGIPSFGADLRHAMNTSDMMQKVCPRLVVHAAYAKDRASCVEATHNVVAAARSCDAPVVFCSTDAVFRGDGIRRDELCAPDPTWEYGQWKAEAEEIVISAAPTNAVIRLPLLVSLEPDDHVVRQIREGAARGSCTKWYVDEIRQPALASEVAMAILQIAELGAHERVGYWHLAGPLSLSRFEIALQMLAQLGLSESTIEAAKQPPNSSRPMNIVLGDERARTGIGWSPSPIA